MATPAANEIRAFVPSKDFALAKSFYEAIGFDRVWEGDRMCEFRIGQGGFFLQDYYQEQWAKNCMMNLLVPDVAAWHDHVRTVLDRFPGARITEPKVEPWGKTFALIDPTGVLWHIQQR